MPIQRLALNVRQAGGRAFLVGGCVRDLCCGRSPSDYDLEAFGLTAPKLEALLKRDFGVVEVGKAFGVFKLRGLPIDVSLLRRESKQGTGHKGFRVVGDPHLDPAQAAARRDFTINAISWDPLTGQFLDPCGGMEDLRRGILRHIGPAFSEDPLRVLRGMQFVARFELQADPATVALCRTITPENLPQERVFEEWRKLLVSGPTPSLGLEFLRQSDWVRYFPELHRLIGCPQDPQWHPEGDVWTHTLHCLDAFARERIGDPWEDLVVGLAVLCHDFGKPATTFIGADGRVRSIQHEVVGGPVTRRFLGRLTRQTDLVESVIPLVLHHMRPAMLHKESCKDGPIRRLSLAVGRIDRLVRLVSADMQGSPPLVRNLEACSWLLQRAADLSLQDSIPDPLILGRHLLAAGLLPGPHFKPILQACYEAQLDGQFSSLEQGLEFLQRILPRFAAQSPSHQADP